jgi:lipid II:glycine glycyltransferase (peptidoglycan interpeptide bridge formation enzyme)
MNLIAISESNKSAYQAFVQKHGSFLQDFFWGEFQKTLGKNVYSFALLSNNAATNQALAADIIATVQLIEIPALGHFYLHAPYGPVLPSQNSTAEIAAAIKFLFSELSKKFPNALFIRIEPQDLRVIEVINRAKLKKSADLNPHKTLILDLSKNSEQLLSEMHPKTRYNIKVAEKSGIKIKSQQQIDSIKEGSENIFKPLLDAAKRAGIRSLPASYYQAIADFFCVNVTEAFAAPAKSITAKVYTAWHEDNLLATNLMLYYNETAIYLFGGSSNIKRNLMAPYLLHWQAIQDAKNAGFKKYDFWGVEENPNHAWAGISRFKFGFGGEVKNYAGTQDYVCNKAWYNIYNVLRKINRIRHKIT